VNLDSALTLAIDERYVLIFDELMESRLRLSN